MRGTKYSLTISMKKIKYAKNEQEITDTLNKDANAKVEIKNRLEDLYRMRANMLRQKAIVN